MPANLTPQFKSAEARYKNASTVEEKIDALEEMYRTIPKHKGTEKMCADIKQRLSKARQQQENAAKSGKKGISYHVPRDGAAQITLLGPPSSGKSALLNNVTNAEVEVAAYPYTTQKPQPGMLQYENVRFQIIDLPPVSQEYLEPWLPGLIRVCDLTALVINLELPDGIEIIQERLSDYKTELVPSLDQADYKARIAKIPMIVIGTHSDHPDAEVGIELIKEILPEFTILPVSNTENENSSILGKMFMKTLDLIRVYTRPPGKEPDMSRPIVVRRGATLLDVSVEIHRDFAEELKYARVWGSGKFDGQRIQRDYVVEEGDILEFKI